MVEIFGWAAVSVFVGTLIAGGFGVMSTSPPEFAAAKWFFSAAALILAIRLGWWITMEQPKEIEGDAKILIAAFFLFGLVGVLWVGAMSWVNYRERTFASSYVPRTTETQAQNPQQEAPANAGQFTETLRVQQRLTTALRGLRGDQANVLIVYVDADHRLLAEMIRTAFTEAGWETDFRDRPLRAHLPQLTEESAVYGCNAGLVGAVVDALMIVGLSGVETHVEAATAARNTPQWEKEQRSLRVRIGYHE